MKEDNQRIIIPTADGSQTISIPAVGVTYHSTHGAVQESKHVFIEAGLMHVNQNHKCIRIFEMGFGTGLNALLTLQYALKHELEIYYYTAELFPLNEEEYAHLNYNNHIQDEGLSDFFMMMHNCKWEKDISIHPLFTLHKTKQDIIDINTENNFRLIYFDAFAPAIQPELWTKEIFEKMYLMMEDESVLVTYCSKGEVRRAMQAAGFSVEKLKGPPGKREMVRAVKKFG